MEKLNYTSNKNNENVDRDRNVAISNDEPLAKTGIPHLAYAPKEIIENMSRFLEGYMLIILSHLNNQFYEMIRNMNLYKRTDSYDMLRLAIITNNTYIIGSVDGKTPGLVNLASLPNPIEFYNHIVPSQKYMGATFVINCATRMGLTKEEQINSWAEYGGVGFLKYAFLDNQTKYFNIRTDMLSKSNMRSEKMDIVKWQLSWYGDLRILDHFDIFPFQHVPRFVAKQGDIYMASWLLALSFKEKEKMFEPGWETIMCNEAAMARNYDLLEFLIKKNIGKPHSNVSICSKIARNGDLFQLKSFSEMNLPWADNIVTHAVKSGNQDLVKYLVDNGATYNEETCAAAAEYGYLQILIKLREIGCKWDDRTIIAALTSGYTDIAIEALQNGCPASGRIASVIASKGDIGLLKHFVEDEGCPMNEYQTFDHAITSSSIKLVEYCYKNGCPYYDDVSETSAQLENLEIFQYVVKNKIGKLDMYELYSRCLSNRNPEFFNWYITTLSKENIKTIGDYYEAERIAEEADGYTHDFDRYEEDDIYLELYSNHLISNEFDDSDLDYY